MILIVKYSCSFSALFWDKYENHVRESEKSPKTLLPKFSLRPVVHSSFFSWLDGENYQIWLTQGWIQEYKKVDFVFSDNNVYLQKQDVLDVFSKGLLSIVNKASVKKDTQIRFKKIS